MNQKFTRAGLMMIALIAQLSMQAFNVTFRVDMSQQSDFTTPEVNGSFNGWCGGCFQLTDGDGDNIWEGTANLASGAYEYKFAADGWSSQENLIQGSACTVTNFGFTNRSLVVTGDVVLPVVCWGACVGCASAPSFYDVTFQVDMNGQTGFTTPELNGSFNGWCGNCTAMSDANGDGIWSVTVSLQEGSYEYKFSHDNWSGQESLSPGSSCTITTGSFTNRVITVSQDEVLPAVCFGSCAACGVNNGPFDVTFRLDMSDVTFNYGIPEVNGTFNGWCGGCAPMSDLDGDDIWTITIPLQAGAYEYKFAYDNWTGQEELIAGSSCTITADGFTNRTIDVTAEAILDVVCWNSCTACNVIVLNQMNLPVTFDDAQVEYGLIGFDGSEDAAIVVDPTDAANMVARVTKSANAGASSGVTMTAPAELGFSSAVPFAAGATTMSVRVWSPDAGIQVRLKVEDHNDPTHSVETNVTTSVSNDWETLVFDFSNQSAGTAPLNFGYIYDKATIFFNFGVNGATAGEKTYYFDDVEFGGEVVVGSEFSVTFQVDMQNVSGFITPEVNGTFNGWCGGCFPLTDADGDGIWTGTAVIPAGTHEYKFAHDSWEGQENLSPDLSCVISNFGFTNRTLEVNSNIVLPVVCWGSCGNCEETPQSHQVTFQVDMNGVVGFNTPEVNGTFNNWCGNCFTMTDVNGDGIWQATTTLLEGNYEYKFSYDNWSGSEQLTAGDPCTVTNGAFVNRLLNIESDTTLAPVCWAQCEPCSMPEPVSVTFTVDLTGVDASSVEISGSFNNYCTGCQPMTAMGDNMYTTTIDVMPGVLYYWFTINNGITAENLQESTCTVSLDTLVVREVIASEDINVDVVCWESCAACLVGISETLSEQVAIMPNPANESFNLVFPGNSKANYEVIDQTGRVVMIGSFGDANRVNVSTVALPAGIYEVLITNASTRLNRKLIVQH